MDPTEIFARAVSTYVTGKLKVAGPLGSLEMTKEYKKICDDWGKKYLGTGLVKSMYVVLLKAKPYTRTKKGKLEHVKGYVGSKEKAILDIIMRAKRLRDEQEQEPKKVFHGTTARNMYKILFEGVTPQKYHNFEDAYYQYGREKRVFATTELWKAATFAEIASKKQDSPGIVIEAVIPIDFWKSSVMKDTVLGSTAYELPEIKPEWIVNILDSQTMEPVTKTINSLTLKRFEKAGRVVYIPVTLKVLKKIVQGEKK